MALPLNYNVYTGHGDNRFLAPLRILLGACINEARSLVDLSISLIQDARMLADLNPIKYETFALPLASELAEEAGDFIEVKPEASLQDEVASMKLNSDDEILDQLLLEGQLQHVLKEVEAREEALLLAS